MKSSKYSVSFFCGQRLIGSFDLPDCFEQEDAHDAAEDIAKRYGKSTGFVISEETNAAGEHV
tara:strand:- start:71 stop:256 length:186 start_codon:yes stop_codon:yes gene_type:complete